MENSLYKIIENSKNNINLSIILIDKFKPIIKKYSSMLYFNGYDYDDAYQELCIHIIEVIYKLPLEKFSETDNGALINYITLSIKNKYIFISKKNQLYMLKNIELKDIDYSIYSIDMSNLILKDLFNVLTYNQKKIMTLSYIYNLSDSEIGIILNKTRQAVNKSKNYAIKNLRDLLINENEVK